MRSIRGWLWRPEVDSTGAFTVRDESVAENLLWIARTPEPGARIVAWAHNGHIARVDNRGVRMRDEPTRMGDHLEGALGSGYLCR